MNRRLRGLGRRGVSSLEFAIVASVFFMFLLGGMEVGRYLTIVHSLRSLTGETARAALIACNGGAAYSTSTVTGLVPFLDPAKVTLTPTTVTTALCNTNPITVTASYPFTSIVPFFTSMNGALTAASFTTQISR